MRFTLVFFVFVLVISARAQDDVYKRQWSKVYRAEMRGLPRSALKIVDTIYSEAKRSTNINEIAKSLLYQCKFALELEENAEVSVVERFKKEIASSQAPLTNMLNAMLGHMYWEYFKTNRWKYYNRTNDNDSVPGPDFRLWTSRQMMSEIEYHLKKSLENPSLLQKIRLERFDNVLALAEKSKVYRPTLYDFLAMSALDYFEADEFVNETPADDIDWFTYFGPVGSWAVPASSESGVVFALNLYRNVLGFHLNRKDTNAYVDAELRRLRFISNTIDDESAFPPSRDALVKLASAYRNHPASANVDLELALSYQQRAASLPRSDSARYELQEDVVNLCDKIIQRFPSTDAAVRSAALKQEMTRKKLTVDAEQFVPVQSYARLRLEFANLPRVYLSIFKASPETCDTLVEHGFFHGDGLLKGLPVVHYAVAELPSAKGYDQHDTELIVPPLPTGSYFILVSAIKDYFGIDAVWCGANLQVTDLAPIYILNKSHQRLQIVKRTNGAPVAGATVRISGKEKKGAFDKTFVTDARGFVDLGKQTYQSGKLQVHHAYDSGLVMQLPYSWREYNQDEKTQEEEWTGNTVIFTDRSIYRPGQTIYFKGVLYKTRNKKSQVVPGEFVQVYLEDVHGKEIGSKRLKTNHYGSFSGEFGLPANGVTGEYIIYADQDDEGDGKFYDGLEDFEYNEATISVEEYKRPTFEVILDPVKQSVHVNDSVVIHGRATAFSGAFLSGAKVKYQVSRTVSYTRWYRGGDYASVQVALGEVLTNLDGTFSFSFKAIPNQSADSALRPVFRYSISADVTDVNGETRSSESVVKVGYHSLLVSLDVPAKVNMEEKPDVVVHTENLNGQFSGASGRIIIFRLKTPDRPTRKRIWPAPDLPVISKADFRRYFPNENNGEFSDDPDEWPKGDSITAWSFNTYTSPKQKFDLNESFSSGWYVAETVARDSAGEFATHRVVFEITDKSNVSIPMEKLLMVRLDKSGYQRGSTAKVSIASPVQDIFVLIEVEQGGVILQSSIEHLSGRWKTLSVPVKTVGKPINIHYTAAIFNDVIHRKETVPFIESPTGITIETERFRNKIQPGNQETWSFSLRGPGGKKVEAELLASMYDASLDQFKPHEWNFATDDQYAYYSYDDYNVEYGQSFRKESFIGRYSEPAVFVPRQNYDQFDWFGFSLSKEYSASARYMERLFVKRSLNGDSSLVSMMVNRDLPEGKVAGRVVDSDGVPLPGVDVTVGQTGIGTVTDEHGKFQIDVKGDQTLVFSFVGFLPARAVPGDKNFVDVVLTEDITMLSEVVVVGYGVQEKRELAFSVSTVSTGHVQKGYDGVEFAKALQGRVSGVTIGTPGANYQIKFRGTASASDSSLPLYVVDGVIVDAAKIDQSDLLSISILKDAAASAIYGARGANGVVIITTKSGSEKIDRQLAAVKARTDFKETAFFFPHLSTDSKGRVTFSFTTPESLTRWKMQMLAHTRDLEIGKQILQTVTQKELMVTPNMPRFLRVSDQATLSVKISNLADVPVQGTASLVLTNALTGEQLNKAFENVIPNQSFNVAAKGTTEASWRITVPAGVDLLQYKVVAAGKDFSDGEQNVLPVLSNRMLVTETMPLTSRDGKAKQAVLRALSGTSSTTRKNHQLTVEVTSNPVWTALQSLPYLMEFPHECAEQLFSRFYANSLGAHIVSVHPEIKTVFSQWASAQTLSSPLSTNQQLKSVLLEETPWVRDALKEESQKKQMALLFDETNVRAEQERALAKLQDMQLPNGGFPWFQGYDHADIFITRHVAAGYGHLMKLGVRVPDNFSEMMHKAVRFVDNERMVEFKLMKPSQRPYRVTSHDLHYLYMRSFYPQAVFTSESRKVVDFLVKEISAHWIDYKLYQRAMAAIVLSRYGNAKVSSQIIASLTEQAIQSEEMGMYWKENVQGYYWDESPVETQAMLIEAYAEVLSQDELNSSSGRQMMDALRLWLLRHKQTNSWRTTKETTEAIYALVMQGSGISGTDEMAEVTVGDQLVAFDPNQIEAKTGYMKKTWRGEEVKPEMGRVTLTSRGQVAWGGLYWQYFEDLDKIKSAQTGLVITKRVFQVVNNGRGEELVDYRQQVLKPGDLLRIRIELSTDRDMEFVHLKDMRAAGFEPMDVLSGYKYKGGLGFYQSTRDVATHFFFDRIVKGKYVFEYDLRVNLRGEFSNGVATLQCMYAPEFTSHSEGIRVKVD